MKTAKEVSRIVKVFRQFNEDTGASMGVYTLGAKKQMYIKNTMDFTNLLHGSRFDKIKVGEKIQFTGHSYLVRQIDMQEIGEGKLIALPATTVKLRRCRYAAKNPNVPTPCLKGGGKCPKNVLCYNTQAVREVAAPLPPAPAPLMKCPRCAGAGEIDSPSGERDTNGTTKPVQCPDCEGSGNTGETEEQYYARGAAGAGPETTIPEIKTLRLELAAAKKTAEDWELLARHQGETLARHAAEDRSAPEMLAALKRIAIEATTGVDPLVLAQTAYAAVKKAEGK